MTTAPAPPSLMFDHVGIVAKDVDKAARALAATIGASESTQRFDDEMLGVSVRFIRDRAGMVYELIAPFGQESPVAKTLASKTNLLNQIAYRTSSLAESVAALRDQGNLPVGPARPAMAFGGAKVQFLLSELGFLIELIESPNHFHVFGTPL
jgi:methylmalonyl-CoA/ethylmalonyl-CoA epimerase